MRMLPLLALAALLLAHAALAGPAPYSVEFGFEVHRDRIDLWPASHFRHADRALFGFCAEPFDSASAMMLRSAEVKKIWQGSSSAKLHNAEIDTAAAAAILALSPVIVLSRDSFAGTRRVFSSGIQPRPVSARKFSIFDLSRRSRTFVDSYDIGEIWRLTRNGWERTTAETISNDGLSAGLPVDPRAVLTARGGSRAGGIVGVGALLAGGFGLAAMETNDSRSARALGRMAWGSLIVFGVAALASR